MSMYIVAESAMLFGQYDVPVGVEKVATALSMFFYALELVKWKVSIRFVIC